MPNKAKYLTPEQVESIVNSRGKRPPREIAEQYQIGLTRLYKLWTDASENKKFPGGFAGTAQGQHLSDQIEALNKEIDNRRTEFEKLKKNRYDYIAAIKKMDARVKQKQQTLLMLAGRLQEYQSQQQQADDIIIQFQQKENNVKIGAGEIQRLKQQIQQQQQTIAELQKTTTDNDKLITELRQQQVEL